jgi:thiamine biosynthesis protein ThiC
VVGAALLVQEDLKACLGLAREKFDWTQQCDLKMDPDDAFFASCKELTAPRNAGAG